MLKHVIIANALLAFATAAQAVKTPDETAVQTYPYFDSARTKEVTLYQSPLQTSKATWTLHHQGIPLEVIGGAGEWRKVRDVTGTEGWVPDRILSGHRTIYTLPVTTSRTKPTLRLSASAKDDAAAVALVEAGNVGQLHDCSGTWCKVSFGTYQGYLRQHQLWGVYPGEVL